MITESEKNALQLAKRVFEHFTHDALPIAREIIAMEIELGQSPMNGSSNPIREVKTTDGQPDTDYDPSQPVRRLSDELEYQQQDDFPL